MLTKTGADFVRSLARSIESATVDGFAAWGKIFSRTIDPRWQQRRRRRRFVCRGVFIVCLIIVPPILWVTVAIGKSISVSLL
jgi:hypothetical protein